MAKKTSDVFGVTTKVRLDSYIDRGALDNEISRLLDRNSHIALRGESKCGKSWIRQKNIPEAIVVQCRLGRNVIDIYTDALSQLEINFKTGRQVSKELHGEVSATGAVGQGILEKVFGTKFELQAKAVGDIDTTDSSQAVGKDINDLKHIAEIVKASGKRLIVEDFHYLSVDERKGLAFDLKALWDYELYVIIIGVWNQSNLLIFLNPDLAGRIEELQIYWSPEDLSKVLDKGAQALNIEFDSNFKNACIEDCYGNVGLLQSIAIKSLDQLEIFEQCGERTIINEIDTEQSAALQIADQLNPLYLQFAKRVSSGIRTRQDSTGIYAHAMAVILEADDELAIRGMSLDYIYGKAHDRERRIQKGNLRTVLEKFEELQVDEDGRGLVLAYNEANAEITVVDRQLLLYRKYSTVKWPWEDIIKEAATE